MQWQFMQDQVIAFLTVFSTLPIFSFATFMILFGFKSWQHWSLQLVIFRHWIINFQIATLNMNFFLYSKVNCKSNKIKFLFRFMGINSGCHFSFRRNITHRNIRSMEYATLERNWRHLSYFVSRNRFRSHVQDFVQIRFISCFTVCWNGWTWHC